MLFLKGAVVITTKHRFRGQFLRAHCRPVVRCCDKIPSKSLLRFSLDSQLMNRDNHDREITVARVRSHVASTVREEAVTRSSAQLVFNFLLSHDPTL